jgi:hypothetical protein
MANPIEQKQATTLGWHLNAKTGDFVYKSADDIAKDFSWFIADYDDRALYVLHTHEIVVADRDVKGYTPTGCKADAVRYDEAKEMVMAANRIMHPDRSEEDTMKLIASTF